MVDNVDATRATDQRRIILIAMTLMLVSGILATIIHLCVRVLSPRYPAVQIVFLRTFLTVVMTAPQAFLRPNHIS